MIPTLFAIYLQNPDNNGAIKRLYFINQVAHEKEVLVVMGADLMSLLLMKTPGEMGADVVVGSSQRFGVPMGFGGPHAAFFATKDEFKRQMPGRIIGASIDAVWQSGISYGFTNPGATYSPRKGYIQYLYRSGIAFGYGWHVCRIPWTEGLKKIAGRIHALDKITRSWIKGTWR